METSWSAMFHETDTAKSPHKSNHHNNTKEVSHHHKIPRQIVFTWLTFYLLTNSKTQRETLFIEKLRTVLFTYLNVSEIFIWESEAGTIFFVHQWPQLLLQHHTLHCILSGCICIVWVDCWRLTLRRFVHLRECSPTIENRHTAEVQVVW